MSAAEFDPDAYKRWNPNAQEKAAEALRKVQEGAWRPFFCTRHGCDGRPHDKWGWPHARDDQHPPLGD